MMRHMGGFIDRDDVESRNDQLRRMRLDNIQEGVDEYRMVIEQQRRRRMIGERYIQEAANAGHAPSILNERKQLDDQTHEEYRIEMGELRVQAQMESAQTYCMESLVRNEQDHPLIVPFHNIVCCKNPVCSRICYQLRFSGSIVRAWMKAKEDTDDWKTHRTSLMMIYTVHANHHYNISVLPRQRHSILLPVFTNVVGVIYIQHTVAKLVSKACKQIDWIGSHKEECDNYIRDH